MQFLDVFSVTRVFVFAVALGCAPRAATMTVDHPGNPDAPIGRLAGPPPALRPGIAEVTPPAKTPPGSGHEHHDMAPSPPPAAEPPPAQAPPEAPAEKPRKPKVPAAKKPVPEKPKQPTPPAQPGHEGHH